MAYVTLLLLHEELPGRSEGPHHLRQPLAQQGHWQLGLTPLRLARAGSSCPAQSSLQQSPAAATAASAAADLRVAEAGVVATGAGAQQEPGAWGG